MTAAFDAALDRLAADLAALPAVAAGRVAAALLTAVVDGTPVATGRLAAGWRIADTGTPMPRIVNDVPYAGHVEYGTAARPGAAMLRRAVTAVDAGAAAREALS